MVYSKNVQLMTQLRLGIMLSDELMCFFFFGFDSALFGWRNLNIKLREFP